MVSEYLQKAKQWSRKALLACTAIASLYLPAKAESTPEIPTPQTVYTVQEGDSLYDIARKRLGSDATLAEIVEETDRLASLNGKGTLEEYPYQGKPCTSQDYRDPNCIYPSQNITFTKGQEVLPPSETPAQQDSEEGTDYLALVLGLAGLAGIGGITMYARKRDKQHRTRYLEDLVGLKNDNPYKSIDKLVGETTLWPATGKHLREAYTESLSNYVPGQAKIARYDHTVAPEEMKEEMIEKYRNSEMSLEQISFYLANKYGMNISTSTISRRARKELDVKSRKEARSLEVAKAA